MEISAGLAKAKRRTESTRIEQGGYGDDPEKPDYRSASYRAQIVDVEFIRACYEGTKSMREGAEEFLPRHPMEARSSYKTRLKQATAFNAVARTVSGLVGMVFRRDPVPSEDMSPAIVEHMEDVDLRGDAFPIFWRTVAENALVDGHTWVHVETPRRSPDVRTRAQEEAARVRPYWINVLKEQAINVQYELRAGRYELSLFVYLEGATVQEGAFGERNVERIRVLRQANGEGVTGQLWELQEDPSDKSLDWRLVDEYTVDAPSIPVVYVPSYRTTRPGESEPPLRDLAHEQVAHYQVNSDRRKALSFSAVSVPYLFGEGVLDLEGNPKVTWAPDGMLILNDPNAKSGILESAGHGLSALREELQEIEARMASFGLRMLVRRPSPSPQTATEQILGKSQDDAALVVFAKLLEDAANNVLVVHGVYMGEEEPGTVQVNRDFHTQLLDAQTLQQIRDMQLSGQLSLETMWDLLIEGELLDEDFDPELERDRLEGEVGRAMGALLPA